MPAGDLYGLLGLPPSASADDIKTAFRGAARRFHPDVNAAPGATEEFKLISEAHSLLSDPGQRAVYDAGLKQKGAGPALALRAQLSRDKLPVLTEPQVVYALVDIRPAVSPAELPAPPVNLALVLDRSTSMQGSRLDQVKAAVSQLVDSLRDTDTLSVTTFSDRAEAIVPAQRCSTEHRTVAKAKVSTINPSGGTEILAGLLRGMLELRANLSPTCVNHLMLLTDGQTYGDEGDCLLLAVLAASDGVSISGLGLGDEWNDKFLDELTGCTGGTSVFISTPEQVTRFMQEKVRGLGAAFGERLELTVLPDQGVKLLSAFRLTPEAAPLTAEEMPLHLGSLPKDQPLSVVLKFLLPPQSEGVRPIARLALRGDILSLSRRGDRTTLDLAVAAQASPPPFAPAPALVEALGRVSQYTLQERAWQKAASGDIASATRLLTTLGTRLLSSGQQDLAKVTIAEAKRLERTQTTSEEAKKRIKYGTRALIPPPPAGGTGKTRP